MGKVYTLDGKLLTGCPEVRIKDKLYAVDDRTSNVKAIMKLMDGKKNSTDFDEVDKVLELAFGKQAWREIEALELPFPAYQELLKLTISAMTGEEPQDGSFPPEGGQQ